MFDTVDVDAHEKFADLVRTSYPGGEQIEIDRGPWYLVTTPRMPSPPDSWAATALAPYPAVPAPFRIPGLDTDVDLYQARVVPRFVLELYEFLNEDQDAAVEFSLRLESRAAIDWPAVLTTWLDVEPGRLSALEGLLESPGPHAVLSHVSAYVEANGADLDDLDEFLSAWRIALT